MIIPDLLLMLVVLVALIFASITDLKIKEVPDWLSYALIASALVIRLIYSIISSEYDYFFFSIAGFTVMFILGNLLYHTKQWGGGDAKLLMGLGAALATKPSYLPESKIPFIVTLFVFILIAGAVYGLLWSLYLTFHDFKNFKIEFKRVI